MSKENVINEARSWKAKAEGAKAALGLHHISYHAVRIEKAKVEHELASVRIELETLKHWFARAKSQGSDVPEALTIRKLDEWRKLK